MTCGLVVPLLKDSGHGMLGCGAETGHILTDAEAMKMWGRTYEKEWEVTAITGTGLPVSW